MDYYKLYKETGRLLGKGVSGNVVEVTELATGQTFAAKKVWLKGQESKLVQVYHNEVLILKKFKHDNIIYYKDCFSRSKKVGQSMEEEELIIVLEKCEHGDLASICAALIEHGLEESWFPQFVRKYLVGSVLSALALIHGNKIMHRDIKLENLFLSDQFTIKLADFGVSKILEKTLEKANTYIGTPYYLSPEIIEGAEYSSKSDVWSLGVCFYYLLYRRLPFEAPGKIFALQKKIINEEPFYDAQHAEENAIIQLMLAKKEEERPNAKVLLQLPFFQKLGTKPAKVYLESLVSKIEEAKRLRKKPSSEDQDFGGGGLVNSGLVNSGLVSSGLVKSGLVKSGLVKSDLLESGVKDLLGRSTSFEKEEILEEIEDEVEEPIPEELEL